MKLADVFNRTHKGDQFKRSSFPGLSGIEDIRENEIYNLTADDITADDWEIIRAEPEVLTPEESWNNISGGSQNLIKESVFYLGFKKGDKNGQIKEWKRLKPLIDYIETIFAAGNIFKYHSSDDMIEFIKNLTPPWECEK